MNIFLNLLSVQTGGQITRAIEIIKHFKKIDKNVTLVVLKDNSILEKYTSNNRILFINISFNFLKYRLFKQIVTENFRLRTLLKKNSSDIYITFSNYLPIINLNIPTITCVSNLLPFSKEALKSHSIFQRFKFFILKKIIIFSSKRANLTLALSRRCKEILVNYGVPDKRVFVAKNGVDSFWSKKSKNFFLSKRLNIKKDFLLYVSHFYRYKNHIRLLEAFNDLSDGTHAKYQLVFVGDPKDTKYFKDIKLKIVELGLEKKVLLIMGESKKNLRDLYQGTKLFIFPSLIENSPNILLEAMMSGAPIISSNIEPMPEFGGDAIKYFDPFEIRDINSKICSNLEKDKELNNLKKLSVKQAKKFQWEYFTKKLVEKSFLLYKEKNDQYK